jgi:cytosine/adenosine deaminase-related metal-dependent hydrolase
MVAQNSMSTMPTVLRARYVFPVACEPIADGFVAIVDGRIAAVGEFAGARRKYPARAIRDLGNTAILPGLVNAHAHLDSSLLDRPLGSRGIGLPDWLRLAMDHRRRLGEGLATAVARGLRECLSHGVTSVGEIVQPGLSPMVSPVAVTAFLELIGPDAARAASVLEATRNHIGGSRRPGLCPHAPYSVCEELLAAAVELSAAYRIPLAMHIAESPEELDFLQSGGGAFRSLLEELGALDASAGLVGNSMRPLDYLRRLSAAHRALVVHGNYLDDEEIAFLGANAARMSVVYCPRSHEWFGHRPYPLEKMLAAGVSVALGTDGRGSTPDLGLLGEMRWLVRRHPGIGLDYVLRLGTLCGAAALGRGDEIGTLSLGKWADLAVVALPDRDAADPHELLFDSALPVVGCYCRGRKVEADHDV